MAALFGSGASAGCGGGGPGCRGRLQGGWGDTWDGVPAAWVTCRCASESHVERTSRWGVDEAIDGDFTASAPSTVKAVGVGVALGELGAAAG